MIRKRILLIFTVGCLLIFTIQLINLQIINPRYKSLSDNNAIVKRPVFPERGLIFDRNGKLMVANQPAYDLIVVPEHTTTFDTLELCKLLSISKDQLLKQLFSAKRFSIRLPSIVISKISKESHALIQEKIWKYKGFYLEKKSVRDYRIPVAANVLGYVSEVNRHELSNKDYSLGELIGRQGIEKSYEKTLRGEKGVKYFQKDRFNRIIGPYEDGAFNISAKNATNITLTIDSDLQRYGEELLKNKRGGIVAIEPETGEILAMVSIPSYDPNLLVGRKRSKNYAKLAKDTLAKPLFNRGLQAEYAPGSPFKILNALIALQEEAIVPDTEFSCNSGHYYAKNAFMACHCNVYGTNNDLLKGIYRSCNSYFAKTFKRVIENAPTPKEGVDRWKYHLLSFGLGNYLGYDLLVGKAGFIPGGSYYDYWYKPLGWNASTIISNAIGQGEILTTPIQMANFTAAIANQGYYITPHFLKRLNTQEKDTVYPKKFTTIEKKYFETVIEGMRLAVEYGTARAAKIKGIEVCGKTGTVENFIKINGVKQQLADHSVFIAFAPKDKPKIALTVFVENGGWGSSWAVPIASLMIEKYIASEVKRKQLENRMLKGSLLNEYEKLYKEKTYATDE